MAGPVASHPAGRIGEDELPLGRRPLLEHEYIGEAFLVLGNLPKAKEHLAVLNKLCFLPCEEYSDLKKAVQSYESSGGRIKPASKAN